MVNPHTIDDICEETVLDKIIELSKQYNRNQSDLWIMYCCARTGEQSHAEEREGIQLKYLVTEDRKRYDQIMKQCDIDAYILVLSRVVVSNNNRRD